MKLQTNQVYITNFDTIAIPFCYREVTDSWYCLIQPYKGNENLVSLYFVKSDGSNSLSKLSLKRKLYTHDIEYQQHKEIIAYCKEIIKKYEPMQIYKASIFCKGDNK